MSSNIWFRQISAVLVLLLAWQIASWLVNNAMIWPDVMSVMIKLGELLQRVEFLQSIFASLYTALVGFIIVVVVSIPLILLTHRTVFARQILSTLSDLIGPTPTLSWLPVFLIFFGFTKITLYLLICWGVIWLMLQNLYALLDTSRQHWDAQIQNLRFTQYQAWIYVYIPSMWAGFISTGKLYFMQIWRVLFSIEIVFGAIGGHQGLATSMYEFKGKFDHVEVFACLLLIMILGVLIGEVFNIIKRIFQ